MPPGVEALRGHLVELRRVAAEFGPPRGLAGRRKVCGPARRARRVATFVARARGDRTPEAFPTPRPRGPRRGTGRAAARTTSSTRGSSSGAGASGARATRRRPPRARPGPGRRRPFGARPSRREPRRGAASCCASSSTPRGRGLDGGCAPPPPRTARHRPGPRGLGEERATRARAKCACTVSRSRTREPWASARPTAASHASRAETRRQH